MNTLRKSILAIAATATIAFSATAPAQAGWKKPFVQGLGMGVGFGIASAIMSPKPQQTVVVAQPVAYAQPSCTLQTQAVNTLYGVQYQQVQVCY